MSERIYGLNKTTLIDFPGKVASTIFTRGCNMRCPFCHNPDFIEGKNIPDLFSWSEIMEYLNKRSKLLGGVCITGGEPLIHNDLQERISEIHKLGLAVKLDTNGSLPERLRNIKVDYIAMDLKTSLENYPSLGFTGNDSELAGRVAESISLIKASGIRHHFRTTVVPGFVDMETIRKIIKLLDGEERFVLQGFRPGTTYDPSYSELTPPTQSLLDQMKEEVEAAGISCDVHYNI